MMNQAANKGFAGLTLFIFLALLVPNIFREGLFMDGLIYSTIAHNMSDGLSAYWIPSFSETYGNTFYEHPPLAFIIQSFFFDSLGDGFYVEKIYSFLTAVLTAFFIVRLWQKTSINKEIRALYWLPVLLWITMPSSFWAYNNNMLENTMGLFSIASTYILLESLSKDWRTSIGLYSIAGTMLLLSFLSKGFPGLFPLGFFFCYGIVNLRSFGIKQIIIRSLILIMITAIIAASFFYFNTAAKENITNYLNTQVMESLSGKRVVGNRLYIMGVLLEQLIITLVISLTLIGLKYRFSLSKLKKDSSTFKVFLLFIVIGLSASVPIMISPKQLKFYIVPALPYFALAFSMLIAQIVAIYLNRINTEARSFSVFRLQAYVTIPLLIIFSVINFGKTSRDQDMIHDVDRMGEYLPNKAIIGISRSLHESWNFMGYCQRKYQISLDRTDTQRDFYLTTRSETINRKCEKVEIELREFELYKCKESSAIK